MPGRSLMADAAPALASHQLSSGVVGVATDGCALVRSTIASCARSRRWRRCSLRRWRLAYRSRTHSATGAFQGCCGDGWFFNRLRGLKPSSFAMRTSAGESRQRRAASAHALSSATFSAIGLLEPSLNAKRARLYGLERTRMRPTPPPCHTQLTNARRSPECSSGSSLVVEGCVDTRRGRWTARATMLGELAVDARKVALSR